MFDMILVTMFVLAAIIQTWGAHLERRPCKYVKYSYAISLMISASILTYCAMSAGHSDFGYHTALFLLGFNILLGGVVRLHALRVNTKDRRERYTCER